MGPINKGNARREILQGVYEDNLRTVRKEPSAPRFGKVGPAIRKGRVPIAAATVIAFLSVLFFPGLLSRVNDHPVASPAGFISPLLQTNAGLPTRGIMDQITALSVVDHARDTLEGLISQTRGNDIFSEGDIALVDLFGLQVRTIVIDPGHGGIDGGTVGTLGTKEKDITLDVVKRLRRRLERRHGYRVLLTREGDTKVSLRDRVAFANERQADLFVSIHVNYLPAEPLNVIETYYFGPQADDAALRLAEKENEDSEYSVAEFNEMLQKIGTAVKLQESKKLANSIQKTLYRNMQRIDHSVTNWGVKSAPFVVLLGVESPSVLAEIACLSNRAEEEKLNTNEHRELLAMSLEEGIVKYLKQSPTQYEPSETLARHATEEDQIGR